MGIKASISTSRAQKIPQARSVSFFPHFFQKFYKILNRKTFSKASKNEICVANIQETKFIRGMSNKKTDLSTNRQMQIEVDVKSLTFFVDLNFKCGGNFENNQFY